MSILGNRVIRTEDPRLLRGEATYVEDFQLEGAAHAVFVRSPFAHARILSVDTSAVAGARVFTAAEVPLEPRVTHLPSVTSEMPQPRLARDVVRYVGEPVAVVVADTRAEAVDAAELVLVDYEPLPVVLDLEQALAGDVLLFPEIGTNVCAELPGESDENLFEGCAVVVSGRLVSQRLAPAPLEPRATTAVWEDGRLTAWVSTQAPHSERSGLATAFGLEDEQVRVIAPDVGGGFGAKDGGGEAITVAWLARELERPVRWIESRSESMVALGHGRAQVIEYELGGSRDGKLLAYRLRSLQDAGAYPSIGAFLPFLTRMMASGVYAIPRIEFSGQAVVTNTAPTVAYRGAGRPEATQAIERAIDLFAAEIGMDPAEVRRENLIPADAFPYTTASGATYDVGDYEGALDLLLAEADYPALREEQRRRRAAGDTVLPGLGLSIYVEITNGFAQPEFGEVEVQADGTAIVRTGSSAHGQGHETSFAMLAAERLGLPLESITVLHGDTDIVLRGTGTYGSRSLQTGGTAVDHASIEVVELGRARAADLLEAALDDVVFDTATGRFRSVDAPEPSLSWAEVASADGPELRAHVDFQPAGPTWPFGAHLAVVEVDTETGMVKLERLIAVDDAGTILNPLIADGQRHGGIAQGVAQALLEEFVYDEDGNPLTLTFADYWFPSAAELPMFELIPMETPTPLNSLGAKGIGESGTIGSTPAVLNAVIDALEPFGVRHLDMPTTPERVWSAIRSGG